MRSMRLGQVDESEPRGTLSAARIRCPAQIAAIEPGLALASIHALALDHDCAETQ